MSRLVVLVVLLGCSSEPGRATLDASTPDVGGTDSFVPSDTGDGSDARTATDGGTDASEPDASAEPVDCSGVGGELCAAFEDSCEVVFHEGEGCAGACGRAGLVCIDSYENIDDVCAADRERPSLGCANTGHQSDFCICGRGECTPPCGDPDPEPSCETTPYDPDALLDELVGYGRRAVGGDPSKRLSRDERRCERWR